MFRKDKEKNNSINSIKKTDVNNTSISVKKNLRDREVSTNDANTNCDNNSNKEENMSSDSPLKFKWIGNSKLTSDQLLNIIAWYLNIKYNLDFPDFDSDYDILDDCEETLFCKIQAMPKGIRDSNRPVVQAESINTPIQSNKDNFFGKNPALKGKADCTPAQLLEKVQKLCNKHQEAQLGYNLKKDFVLKNLRQNPKKGADNSFHGFYGQILDNQCDTLSQNQSNTNNIQLNVKEIKQNYYYTRDEFCRKESQEFQLDNTLEYLSQHINFKVEDLDAKASKNVLKDFNKQATEIAQFIPIRNAIQKKISI